MSDINPPNIGNRPDPKKSYAVRVGEVRPSQVMFTYGVGAIVDLPKISVIVTGLEDWPTDPQYMREISEERLLSAVRFSMRSVRKLLAPPQIDNDGQPLEPFDILAKVGVPVATFPRWLVCPLCRTLAPIQSGLFELYQDPIHQERTVYRHINCNKSKGRKPEVVPARFMVACPDGHLDDFPWIEFVHQGVSCDAPQLQLLELGASGEVRDIEVKCIICNSRRRLAEAFGQDGQKKLPKCRGRRPHLRDYDIETCTHRMRPITLGTSNTWFPVVLSTLAIPLQGNRLAQLIEDNWARVQVITSSEVLVAFRSIGQITGELATYSDEALLRAIQKRHDEDDDNPSDEQPDLRAPEWEVLTRADPATNSADFRVRAVLPPERFQQQIGKVVLVERLREVTAMIGFTRIDAWEQTSDPETVVFTNIAPLSRQIPTWVPANEIRGEGIFIQFNEEAIQHWSRLDVVRSREAELLEAHRSWRQARRLQPPEEGYPGIRYVLLHTFAHVLMRQLSLDCGYASASLRERIYSRPPQQEGGPMAGVLIYTSAPDSEGTLGGLVSLGNPNLLSGYLQEALEAAKLCASDPICAERIPGQGRISLHGASCHACSFAPETSCERGNKYLDRSVLVPTLHLSEMAFFDV